MRLDETPVLVSIGVVGEGGKPVVRAESTVEHHVVVERHEVDVWEAQQSLDKPVVVHSRRIELLAHGQQQML